MVSAVAERVLKIVIHAEAGAKNGFGTKRAPGDADARLRKEFCVVDGEEVAANVGLRIDDAVRKSVVGSAVMGFIPASGKFIAEAEGERKLWADANDVLGVPSAKE